MSENIVDLVGYGGRELMPPPLWWADGIVWDPLSTHEIVEDVFTAGAMSIVYGESNSGKTTLLLDLALRMPAGLPWLGKRVEPGAVIYVAAESPSSILTRLHAFRVHHGHVIGAFGLIPKALELMTPAADVDLLIDLILREQDRLKTQVRMVPIDTASRVMAGANENASEDMSRLVAAGDEIRSRTGAHVPFVHHSGKDSAKGARGHSSLRAAVDTEIEVTHDEALGQHVLTVTKQRDLSSKGLCLASRFRSVELGVNQWGKPITACVVEEVTEMSPHMRSVMQSVEENRAEEVALAGFHALTAQGIKPSDSPNSRDYLPRQILQKSLAQGLDDKALAGAVNRLMAKGIMARGVIGQYANRHPKEGLLLCAK